MESAGQENGNGRDKNNYDFAPLHRVRQHVLVADDIVHEFNAITTQYTVDGLNRHLYDISIVEVWAVVSDVDCAAAVADCAAWIRLYDVIIRRYLNSDYAYEIAKCQVIPLACFKLVCSLIIRKELLVSTAKLALLKHKLRA